MAAVHSGLTRALARGLNLNAVMCTPDLIQGGSNEEEEIYIERH